MKVTWHLCGLEQQVALLLSWLPPKLVHLWDLKAPTELTQCALRVSFPSLFNEHFKCVYTYTSVCSCAHNATVACHWQVESTYVTIVVGTVTECVHAVWLFVVLSTTQHYRVLQKDIPIAVYDCCGLWEVIAFGSKMRNDKYNEEYKNMVCMFRGGKQSLYHSLILFLLLLQVHC